MTPLMRSLAAPTLLLAAASCTDLSTWATSSSKQFAGCVVGADFVLAGVSPTTELCLTFDPANLQTSPGTLTSTDGRFNATPLRSIPQLWNDPLSTFNFGEGRTKNLIYMATPSADAGGGPDVTVVVSLMEGGNVEVRLVRGAPPLGPSDGGPQGAGNIFAVAPMKLLPGGCATLSVVNCAPDASFP